MAHLPKEVVEKLDKIKASGLKFSVDFDVLAGCYIFNICEETEKFYTDEALYEYVDKKFEELN